MGRNRAIRTSALVLILAVPIAAWLVSEIRWARVNSPQGRFSTVAEYLAIGRIPSYICRVERFGKSFFVAYGPLEDTWLAVPSGPAAYVFGPDGSLVDWSADIGDDPAFRGRWLSSVQAEVSVDDLRELKLRQAD